MAPGDLQEVLEVLKPGGEPPPSDLLVGLGAADDAAVYRIGSDVAIVETVDFFPPVVDDPWTWGAVAAVNAMSDVYAMGGEVMFALAIAGFPREMAKTIVSDVFRGGRDKVAEAGGVIAGGHTVVDAEPKYGLCVTGRVHPDRILIKGATDITGFGFLGHAGEMVRASRAGLALDASRLPILPGTRELAEAGQFSGGMKRNRRHVDSIFGADLSIDPSVPGYLASLLTESETSGGLLFSVAPDRAGTVLDAFRRQGEECWEIGSVLAEPVIRVRA